MKLICCSCTAIRFFLLVVRNLTNAADKTNPYLHDVKQKSVIVQKKNEKRIDMGKLWKVTSTFQVNLFLPFSFIICEYVIYSFSWGKESGMFSHFFSTVWNSE